MFEAMEDSIHVSQVLPYELAYLFISTNYFVASVFMPVVVFWAFDSDIIYKGLRHLRYFVL